MTSIRSILLLFVVYLAMDRSYAAVYPYINQDSCTMKTLDISQLTGDWYLVYSKDPVKKEVKLTIQKTGNNTVSVETREGGNLVKTVVLTQNPYLPGKLEELKSKGSYTIGIPWFFLDLSPNSMSIYHGHELENSDTWAIYSRQKTLAEADYTKSVKALNCAKLKNDKDKPLVFKAIF